MFSDILYQCNWVDILTVTLIGRMVYIGFKNGFIVELFKCLGAVFGIFIAFHYFSLLAEFIQNLTPLNETNSNQIAFAGLVLFVLLSFKLIRDGVMLVTKVKMHPVLDRWSGAMIAIIRSFLMVSLILVFLHMVMDKVGREDLKKSVSYHLFYEVAPAMYHGMFNFIQVAFPEEKMNFNALSTRSVEIETHSVPLP